MRNKCLNCGGITENKKFCSLKCHHINRVKEQGVWNKGMLIVHHKDKDRTNNKLSNLMTLCMSCHNKKKTHNG
jgi:Fe-S-cluster-containing dehydrogenase component